MDDEKLIASVRARSFIYTKSDKDHSNRDVLSAAWENVAREVGENVTAADCRKRWATLRDHFRKKHREITTTMSGQAATKKRKWYLYDFLTFLVPSCSTGATSGNLQQNDEDSAASSCEEKSTKSPLSVHSDESCLPTPSLPAHVNKTHRFSKYKNPQKQQLSVIDREVIQALKEPEKEVDQNELFFKSLLPAMKSLSLVKTLELRSDIQRLVLSAVKSAQSDTAAVVAGSNARLATSPPSSTGVTNAMYQDSQNDRYYRQEQYTTAMEASHARHITSPPASRPTSATDAIYQEAQNDRYYIPEQYFSQHSPM